MVVTYRENDMTDPTCSINTRHFIRRTIWDKVAIDPNPYECWLWKGHTVKGYGRVWDGVGQRLAHRVTYTLAKGPIPADLVIDHMCRTPQCVNPKHLQAITVKQNCDGVKKKTHCIHGHEFTEASTYVAPGTGKRSCQTCHLIRRRKISADNKAAKALLA